MRIKNIIFADIRFQIKYGFYFLYGIFTAVYLFFLSVLPKQIRDKVALLLVFSDPAAMGLFFMGAIVLLERNQRVLESLAVSPIRFKEYLGGKTVSIGIISTVVSAVLFLGAGNDRGLFIKLVSVFSASAIFSLIGLLAAFYSSSLNQFILFSAAAEIVFCIPGILWLLDFSPYWLIWHPGILAAEGVKGSLSALPFLILWVVLVFFAVNRLAEGRFRREGGIQL